MKGAGGAIVPAIVCSGMEAQETGTSMGTKWHMAQISRGVRQEPSGEKRGVYWVAWLPPSLLSDQTKFNVGSSAWGSGPLTPRAEYMCALAGHAEDGGRGVQIDPQNSSGGSTLNTPG